MPRHVSSPRMLSWRQRTAIAAPILLLASVAALALTGDGDETPTASHTNADVTGLNVATTDPIATHPSDPRAGSSGPGTTERDAESDEPEREGDRGRADRDDESDQDRDSVSRDEDSDHGTSPAEEPNRDNDEQTIDPGTDDVDEDSGNDNGDGNDEQDHSDADDTDQGDGDEGDSDHGGTEPTTPPDEDESDRPETIDRAEAIRRCRDALSGAVGLGGLGQSIRSCVDDLVGTPLARVDATLNRTVSGLLGDLRDDSSDGQSGGGLLCGILGTCRDQ